MLLFVFLFGSTFGLSDPNLKVAKGVKFGVNKGRGVKTNH